MSQKKVDWGKYHNRHSSKSIWVIKLSFCQNDPPMGESFWQKHSLITYILFRLCLLWYLAQSTFLGDTLYKVNSVQEACAKCFAVHILKFEILQTTWKTKQKHWNTRFIGEIMKTKSLMIFVKFFSCDWQDFKFWFVNIARFQILICEPRSIWRKLLVLSWLYMILSNLRWSLMGNDIFLDVARSVH